MLSEVQVRNLLDTLQRNSKTEANLIRLAAFSGGVSALLMVLEEEAR